jgi:hypothetical protein
VTALQDPRSPEPEVLIEEARRRQRRRRASLAAVAGALVFGAAIFGPFSGGGSPTQPRPGDGGGNPGSALTATWHELSTPGAYIPPAATVTDVVPWRGRLYATGQVSGRTHLSGVLTCRAIISCAAVWTSRDGRRWHATYAARALGSADGESLVAMRDQLLLFDSDEFAALWRSTNGRTWRAVKLPAELAGGEVSGAVSAGGRRVVLFGNGMSLPAGKYRHADFAWTSTDGLRWRPVTLPGRDRLEYLEQQQSGFLAVGTLRSGKGNFILRSATGLRWRVAASLRLPHPWKDTAQDLLFGSRAMVLQLMPPPIGPTARAQLWYSLDGVSWSRASVQGRLPIAGGMRYAPSTSPQVLAVPGGLIDYDSSNTRFWWSRTGRVWRRLRVTGGPPANLSPQGLYVDGDSLIVTEQATRAGNGFPEGATTFWRLDAGLSPRTGVNG